MVFLKELFVFEFAGWLFRLVLKLVLGATALIFIVCLLFAALVTVIFVVLKALLTGKKPRPGIVFGRFRQYSPQDIWRRQSAATPSVSEVVDVEARDITTRALPAASTSTVRATQTGLADDISDVPSKKLN